MKVHEMIEWLKTQDQDATVEVVLTTTERGHWDSYTHVSEVDFDPARGSLHCKEHWSYCKYSNTLTLGQTE